MTYFPKDCIGAVTMMKYLYRKASKRQRYAMLEWMRRVISNEDSSK